MSNRVSTALLICCISAIALSLFSQDVLSTLGLTALSTILLLPIVCAIPVSRNVSSLWIPAFLWRHIVVAGTALVVLPYYAIRNGTDAVWYDEQATIVTHQIHDGEWSQITIAPGSNFVSFITGLLYAPFGPTIEGATFTTGMVGFTGAIFFVLAFGVHASEKGLKQYSKFVLFLPSLVFWSTLFGKDSWVFCGLGITTWGIANWLNRQRLLSLIGITFGVLLVFAFRPHISLGLLLSIVLTGILSRERTLKDRVASVLLTCMVVPILILLVPFVTEFVGLKEVSSSAVVNRLEDQGSGTALGGSVVKRRASSDRFGFLTQLPSGAVRLLFRPWPWEVTSFFGAVAAADNILLVLVLLVRHRTVITNLQQLRKSPFVLFCLLISLQLIVVFSTIPNLGLLMREKTQITVFLYVLAFAQRKSAAVRRFPPAYLTMMATHKIAARSRSGTVNPVITSHTA